MKSKFSKPTVDDIVKYLIEVKNYIKSTALEFAERFHCYYESKGWVVGKSPMKDWKAAIRTWELNNKKYATDKQAPKDDYSKFGKAAGTIRAAHEFSKELGLEL